MEKEALCEAEMNGKRINKLIAEIVQFRFRIEKVQGEKDIDAQRLRNENARLQSEIGGLRQCINGGSTPKREESVGSILRRLGNPTRVINKEEKKTNEAEK